MTHRQLQIERANLFHSLHDRRQILLLPNAWDAGSASLFSGLGFSAIATTSGGVAWSLGFADGEQAPLAEVAAAMRRIVRVTSLPVSMDLEGGYGEAPEQVAASVHEIIDTGVVGINLEDGVQHKRLRDLDEAVQRIAAAREAACEAGIPIFINARVDVWMVATTEDQREEDRREEAIRRAHAYLAAGADGIYPIGLANPETIQKLTAAIHAPINLGARAGLPSLDELDRLGVARVSTATRLAMIAFSAAREAALSIRENGNFDALSASLSYNHMQSLFTKS